MPSHGFRGMRNADEAPAEQHHYGDSDEIARKQKGRAQPLRLDLVGDRMGDPGEYVVASNSYSEE